jgi:hypothetical protein
MRWRVVGWQWGECDKAEQEPAEEIEGKEECEDNISVP